MRFAKNRLYIESYTKCPNCGILIYEELKAEYGRDETCRRQALLFNVVRQLGKRPRGPQPG